MLNKIVSGGELLYFLCLISTSIIYVPENGTPDESFIQSGHTYCVVDSVWGNKKQKWCIRDLDYNNLSLCVEMEMFVQTKMRPEHNMTAAIQQKQAVSQQPRPEEEEKDKSAAKPSREQGALPAIITILLLIPLLVVISIGVFICWRKKGMYDNKAMGQKKVRTVLI